MLTTDSQWTIVVSSACSQACQCHFDLVFADASVVAKYLTEQIVREVLFANANYMPVLFHSSEHTVTANSILDNATVFRFMQLVACAGQGA